MKRPKSNRLEGTTPALSDEQARALLHAPQGESLKAKRDRALLATLAYHGLRREERGKLRVQDLQRRDGVLQFRMEGKGEKVRYVPVGMKAPRLIIEYLEAAGHKEELEGPLFRPVQNRVTGELNKPLHPVSVYHDIVNRYGQEVGITTNVRGFCVHSLRATAATNALAHGADIAKVQEWLEHADISTTRLYDRRAMHEAAFEAGWDAEGLLPRHRAVLAAEHQGQGREVICLDWTLLHHERGPEIYGVTKSYDYVQRRLGRFQTVVTAVIANQQVIDGIDLQMQEPSDREAEETYLKATVQDTSTQMEQARGRLLELLHHLQHRLAYKKRTEIVVEMMAHLEEEGQFPQADCAFDNGV